MSGNIPLELQVEIIKRVPVKQLLQFRTVSKQWKSVIDSPEFSDDYSVRQPQPDRLLIRYIPIDQQQHFTTSTTLMDYFASILNCPPDNQNYNYVSIADTDNNKYHQKQIPSTMLPKSVNNLKDSNVIGSCHGLICFYGYGLDQPFPYDYRDKSYMAVLWNPWIRKFVDVHVPNVLCKRYQTNLGFGVSRQDKDVKIVKINSFKSFEIDTPVCIPWRVEVFSLSSGKWKNLSCSRRKNLPCRNSIRFCWGQVVLDGVIYWHAFEMINGVDGRSRHHNLIMSFDLSSERFEEVCLPDNLAHLNSYKLYISKRMESVVVLELDENRTSLGVWMMGQGVTKSFTKLFTVTVLRHRIHLFFFIVRGFMKNGEPIVDHGSHALFAYDSYSERIKDLGIVGHSVSFCVRSYMETLLLIDR